MTERASDDKLAGLDPKAEAAMRKVARELGANFPGVMRDAFFDIGRQMVEAYLRALPASGGERRVVVKPLEWHGDEAITPFGRYKVIRTEDGYEAAFEWDEIAHVGFNAADDARCAAVEHAEADYEARIRALSLQQGEVEPVAYPRVDGKIAPPVEIGYTNYRGEFAVRCILPLAFWYGSTDWHPEPQWLVKAYDADKGAERDFAFKDFGPTPHGSEP